MDPNRSFVTNENGEITHVDISDGDRTYRYSTYSPGDTTPARLEAVQDHESGEFREAHSLDWFGNPYYE